MDEYGQTIRKIYSTKRPLQMKDPVVNYLSYWTAARLLLSDGQNSTNLNHIYATVLFEYECVQVCIAIRAVLQCQ